MGPGGIEPQSKIEWNWRESNPHLSVSPLFYISLRGCSSYLPEGDVLLIPLKEMS